MKTKDRLKELEAENRALKAHVFYLESPVKQMLDMALYITPVITAAARISDGCEYWGEKMMEELEAGRASLAKAREAWPDLHALYDWSNDWKEAARLMDKALGMKEEKQP